MMGTKCDTGPDVEMEVGGFNLPVTIFSQRFASNGEEVGGS